jgi:hypothetical protein
MLITWYCYVKHPQFDDIDTAVRNCTVTYGSVIKPAFVQNASVMIAKFSYT